VFKLKTLYRITRRQSSPIGVEQTSGSLLHRAGLRDSTSSNEQSAAIFLTGEYVSSSVLAFLFKLVAPLLMKDNIWSTTSWFSLEYFWGGSPPHWLAISTKHNFGLYPKTLLPLPPPSFSIRLPYGGGGDRAPYYPKAQRGL
jgi:hypothetical protein